MSIIVRYRLVIDAAHNRRGVKISGPSTSMLKMTARRLGFSGHRFTLYGSDDDGERWTPLESGVLFSG